MLILVYNNNILMYKVHIIVYYYSINLNEKSTSSNKENNDQSLKMLIGNFLLILKLFLNSAQNKIEIISWCI